MMWEKLLQSWVVLLCVISPVAPTISSSLQHNGTIKHETVNAGHYPHYYCQYTDAWLDTRDGGFYFQGSEDEGKRYLCGTANDIWKVVPTQAEVPKCSRTFEQGHTFTIYYMWGSNYYHMHYDVLLPLYQALYYNPQKQELGPEITLMPVIETSRMKIMNWDTPGFQDMDKWWMQLVKTIAGGATLLPLDAKVRQTKEIICFKKLFMGADRYSKSDSDLVKSFVSFIKKKFGVEERNLPANSLAIIDRQRRRKLTNVQEMAEAVRDLVPTTIIRFEGMSFKEQVETMQRNTIVVGMNGAGFMNCLYLPPGGVAIQLAPFNSTLNVKQFGEFIGNRGPYLQWYNTHKENHHRTPNDEYDSRPDTTVHVGEFRELITRALGMVTLQQETIDDEL